MGFKRGSKIRRQLDYVFGVPLILLIALFRRTRAVPESISSVAILSGSAIGDTIVASGIARDLKSRAPDCFVTVFVAPSASGISTLVEGFDREVIVPVTRPLKALKILREYPSDVLLDVVPWPRITAIIAALSNASFTVGFKTARQVRHFAYDVAVRHRGSVHEIENLRNLLAPLSIRGKLLPRAKGGLRTVASSRDPKRCDIVFHPWASGFRYTMREWPLERWVELAHQLIDAGATIWITGGPSDQPKAQNLEVMINRPGRTFVLAGSAGLYETGLRIADAALVVCVNTGIMHLAAALGQKMVALHGPTNPARWGPLSDSAIVVGPGKRQGGAYLNFGFEYPAHAVECMQFITTRDVLWCVRHVLELSSDSRQEMAPRAIAGLAMAARFEVPG
jgi:heptosyltransferase-3